MCRGVWILWEGRREREVEGWVSGFYRVGESGSDGMAGGLEWYGECG